MTEWMAVPGWELYYDVSDTGLVRSIPRRVATKGGFRITKETVLRPFLSRRGTGYQIVTLCGDNHRKHEQVHRLVLAAFVGPCPDGMQGCHNNGRPLDNRLENLRWATIKENHADKHRHGTWQGGERCGRHKLTGAQVAAIRSSNGTLAGIGRDFGISESTVSQIRRGKTWRHLLVAA